MDKAGKDMVVQEGDKFALEEEHRVVQEEERRVVQEEEHRVAPHKAVAGHNLIHTSVICNASINSILS